MFKYINSTYVCIDLRIYIYSIMFVCPSVLSSMLTDRFNFIVKQKIKQYLFVVIKSLFFVEKSIPPRTVFRLYDTDMRSLPPRKSMISFSAYTVIPGISCVNIIINQRLCRDIDATPGSTYMECVCSILFLFQIAVTHYIPIKIKDMHANHKWQEQVFSH